MKYLVKYISVALLLLTFIGCAKKITEGNASGPVVDIDGAQVRHGIWVEHFEDGSRKSHGRYTRGIRTGLHRTWHPGGALATERRYDWEGRLHEKQNDFNEDGERTKKVFYEHGEEAVDEDDEEEGDEEGGSDEKSVEPETVSEADVPVDDVEPAAAE